MEKDDVLNRYLRLDRRRLAELLIHYEDIFGKAPRLEDIGSRKVPELFLRNLKTLEGMFRSGKVSPCEKCPTCQEIMRGRSLSHGGFEREHTKVVGRYSEALDAQIELAEFFSSPRLRTAWETMLTKHFEKSSTTYRSGQISGMVLPPLLRGEVFYWSEPICELIASAAESIPGTWTLREESLEALHGFAWLARPIKIKSSEQRDETEPHRLRAIGWFPMRREGTRIEEVFPPYGRPVLTDSERHALALIFFSEPMITPVPFPRTIGFWPINEPLSEIQSHLKDQVLIRHGDPRGITIHEKLSLFATMVAFIEQHILITPKFLAARAVRRRAERASQKPPSEEIRVITLRRVERRTGMCERRDVEWACQWIVRGHWRNQWYRSRKHYRPKWIAPYVKGPEDKPLRTPGRLFAVIR